MARAHSPHVAEPTKELLAKYYRYTSNAGVFQNLYARYFVLPLNAQNALQGSQVKAVEFFLRSHVSGPCVSGIEECVECTGLVDTQLSLLCEVGVFPNPLVQSGHDHCCLGDPVIHLSYGERAGDGRPEVG